MLLDPNDLFRQQWFHISMAVAAFATVVGVVLH